MWVFDATPLIYLAKVEALTLVKDLDGSCIIPERVYDEVVTNGLENDHSNARRVERGIDDGYFEVRPVQNDRRFARLQTNSHLSDADVAVLVLADSQDGVAVMDETYGRDVAAAEEITTRGTAYVVLSLTKQGAISDDDARTVIDEMIDAGWYCAPDVYTKIVRQIEDFAD